MTKDVYGGFEVKCEDCSTKFRVYPEGPEYIEILDNECPWGDILISNRSCPSCEFQNKIIWHKSHEQYYQKDYESAGG
jgi:hypothetical protein